MEENNDLKENKIENERITSKYHFKVQNHMKSRLRTGELFFHCEILKEMGFEMTEKNDFNFQISLYLNKDEWQNLQKWQKVDTLAGQGFLCMKDNLHKTLNERQKQFPQQYSFWPKGYVLPQEWEAFGNDMKENKSTFIFKPFNASCGRKIRISNSFDQVDEEWCKLERPLAQKYILDPLLYHHHKISFRIYCLVTGVDPLNIFLFPEGLVRIASKKYDEKNFQDLFIHLDSIDINHVNEQIFVEELCKNQSEEQEKEKLRKKGLRRKLSKLLEELDFDKQKMWNEIEGVVVKTILAAERNMTLKTKSLTKSRHNSFVYFGYDIMLDNNGAVYLLEVNNTPSLKPKTKLENKIKRSMLKDAYQIVDVAGKRLESVQNLCNQAFHILSELGEERLKELDDKYHPFSFSFLSGNKSLLYSLIHSDFQVENKGNFKHVFPTKQSDSDYTNLFLKNFNIHHIHWKKQSLSVQTILSLK